MSPSQTQPPTILLTSSTTRTTYRIPPSHAHPFASLLSLSHSLFSLPESTHSLHLHFEPRTGHTCQCVGRVAPGVWDAGGYFGEEFVGDGKRKGTETLVVYACFEEKGLEEKMQEGRRKLGVEEEDEEEERDERVVEMRSLEGRGNEEAEGGRWWDAVGWWRRAREMEKEMEREKEQSEAEAGKKGLPDLMKKEIRDIVRSEISAKINVTLSENMKTDLAEMVESKIRKVMGEDVSASIPEPKRRRISDYTPDTYDADSLHTVDHSQLPWPIHYASEITPSHIAHSTFQTGDILTIDAYSHTKYLPRDIIIGRAIPSICANPTILPLVRATLVHNLQGLVIYAYIPSKFHKNPSRTGEIQIALSEVEVLRTYLAHNAEASKAKIRHALLKIAEGRETEKWEKKGRKDRGLNFSSGEKEAPEVQDFTTVDTYTGSNFETWDVLVGTPQAKFCKDENVRPIVRATLADGGQVRLYMPAAYGVSSKRSKGEIGVPLGGVDVFGEFDAPKEGMRREKIRMALVEKHEENLREKKGVRRDGRGECARDEGESVGQCEGEHEGQCEGELEGQYEGEGVGQDEEEEYEEQEREEQECCWRE